MEGQNGFLTLAQITIGAYICYFEYIMWLLMMTNTDANETRKNRRSAMRNNISLIIDIIKLFGDYLLHLLR
jgi:hypothetical protein